MMCVRYPAQTRERFQLKFRAERMSLSKSRDQYVKKRKWKKNPVSISSIYLSS